MKDLFSRIFLSGGCAFELIKTIVVLTALLILFHYFVATLIVIRGISMEPNLVDGQLVITNKVHYLFSEPKQGDIIGLRFPGAPDKQKYIKRIIATPGQTVSLNDNQVYIDGKPIDEKYLPLGTETRDVVETKLAEDEYYVMGDNRSKSNDSRDWGVVSKRYIIGKAWLIIYPITEIAFVSQFEY